jgi:hypothetical protein
MRIFLRLISPAVGATGHVPDALNVTITTVHNLTDNVMNIPD